MKKAFTMIELLVVVLILGLLATIAVGVFTTQVERARYAAARSTISALELAINRYQLDLGVFPPSGSNTSAPDSPPPADGSGLLQLALMHSFSGNSSQPSDKMWQGPYINIKKELLGTLTGVPLEEAGTVAPGTIQILDPWKAPYRYVRSGGSLEDNYERMGGTALPGNHPYVSTETYYNPSTFQIVSMGSNGITLPIPAWGRDADDVSNFGL